MYEYAATVLRVVDGDTVDLDFDLGLRVHTEARCRLAGINAPERNTAAGRASASYLATLLPPGRDVRVQTFKDKAEKYGRWLVLIHLGEIEVTAALVELGHAVPWGGAGVRSSGAVAGQR